ncbi:putative zn2+-binding protein melusin contains chord domain [Phaeomoniella chlamydospora]|uniref:Putative zn2+-binding protein melusin contains chord domain n=1 Tax=Phaeomoniella chlamydospora TaxID=158046 RepID=A0A0G2E0V8_PHACM|nr:putative zn2+-binding protein melusin contains chord domain [Phaeomoniella chlamydospora]
MTDNEDFEARRLENIKRKQALLDELGIKQQARSVSDRFRTNTTNSERRTKKRKIEPLRSNLPPTRSSARIASASSKPSYYEENDTSAQSKTSSKSNPAFKARSKSARSSIKPSPSSPTHLPSPSSPSLTALQASWSDWTPTTPAPTRLSNNTFHFPSHPTFTPNLSPLEILQQGAFGGTYFRPLYSRTLNLTITNDYLELPSSWLSSLSIPTHLTSSHYLTTTNKFLVSCGQSIEEWEAAGWINHTFDVRGWFQWYIRFFLGRRCADDDRQVSRWRRCVGPEGGRWRRALLKKYLREGVKTVWDDEGDESREVSPVMHQTCHHWAWEIRQEELDELWERGGL